MLIPFVTVSNAGNIPDPFTGGLYGAVSYDYAISKYDITIQQYVDFLNDVADLPENPSIEALYDTDMQKFSKVIEQTIFRTGSGVAGDEYIYTVASPSSANDPVVFVSWNQAARFVNYLHNGATKGASTEAGAYDFINGGAIPVKSPDAKFWIPSENEWYKAAYFNPVDGAYTKYATQTNALPAKAPPVGDLTFLTNSVNYQGAMPELNKLTPVGAYTFTDSAYGTYDQSGLVWQWTDTTIGTMEVGFNKIVRGGSWSYGIAAIESSTRRDYPIGDTQDAGAYKDDDTGFRIATLASNAATIGNKIPFQLYDLVPQEQIGALYAGMLGRQADNAGFKYWLNELVGAPQTLEAQLATLREIAENFSLSPEARAKYAAYADPVHATDSQIGALIRQQYADLFTLDRTAPATPTDAEVATWTAQFKALAGAGTPVGPVLLDMIASTMVPEKALQHMGLEYNAALQVPIANPLGEYAPVAVMPPALAFAPPVAAAPAPAAASGVSHHALLDPALSNAEFVAVLYIAILHRAPDAGGLAYWLGQLHKGATRDAVVIDFVVGSEYDLTFATNAAYVQGLYQDLLGRDADETGLIYWTRRLDDGMSRDAVAKSFVHSVEFDATNQTPTPIDGLSYVGLDGFGRPFQRAQFIDPAQASMLTFDASKMVVRDVPDGAVTFYANKTYIDPSLPTFVVSLGWTNSGKLDGSSQLALVAYDTLVAKYGASANIISVDWETLASKQPGEDVTKEPTSASTVLKQVGEVVADALIRTGVNIEKTTLIGLSLGAHVMANAANQILNETGSKVAELVALDIAAGSPFFPDYDIDARNGLQRGVADKPLALDTGIATKTTSYTVMDNDLIGDIGTGYASMAADTALSATADHAYLVGYVPLDVLDLTTAPGAYIAAVISNYHVGVVPTYFDLVAKGNLDPQAVGVPVARYLSDGTLDPAGRFEGIIAANQPWVDQATNGFSYPRSIAWVDNDYNPTLFGTPKDDILFLTRFEDPVKDGITFRGGDGDDLIGGYGKIDSYFGGSGSDTFFLGFRKDLMDIRPYLDQSLFNSAGLNEYAVIHDFDPRLDMLTFTWNSGEVVFSDNSRFDYPLFRSNLGNLYGDGTVSTVNGDVVAYIVGLSADQLTDAMGANHIIFGKSPDIDHLLNW